MTDLKRRILKVIGRPFLGAFATASKEGKPWVRYVVAVADEDLTIRFATFRDARKVEQVQVNPLVHVTGGALDMVEPTVYVQVEGVAIFARDREKLQAFWEQIPSSYFEGPDDPNYALIEVTPSRIELWGDNPENSMTPEVWEA